MKRNRWTMIVQYACAVMLIVSSIVLAFAQVCDIHTIANGTLMYIAQAFLLAGSIFGLEYYIAKLNQLYNAQTKQTDTTRNPQQ